MRQNRILLATADPKLPRDTEKPIIWDPRDDTAVPIEDISGAKDVAVSPEGLLVTTTPASPTIKFWDISGSPTPGASLLQDRYEPNIHAKFVKLPTGNPIILTYDHEFCKSNTIFRAWNSDSFDMTYLVECPASVLHLTLSADSALICAQTKPNQFSVWDTRTGGSLTHLLNVRTPSQRVISHAKWNISTGPAPA